MASSRVCCHVRSCQYSCSQPGKGSQKENSHNGHRETTSESFNPSEQSFMYFVNAPMANTFRNNRYPISAPSTTIQKCRNFVNLSVIIYSNDIFFIYHFYIYI